MGNRLVSGEQSGDFSGTKILFGGLWFFYKIIMFIKWEILEKRNCGRKGWKSEKHEHSNINKMHCS